MKFIDKFSSLDLLYIAVLAALGLAIKPIVTPLVHLVSTPLMIPGGSLAGGFYMMWLVLAAALVKKTGAAFLVGFVQSIVILSLGYFGNHGAVSIISYSLPGVAVEILALFWRRKTALGFHISACIAANLTGAVVVTLFIMRLAFIPLLISLLAATISGILGGIISHKILQKLLKYDVVKK
ncbi:MAG: ECF transporter S component [Candidatus Cloacimonadales bacterium]